MNIKTLKLIIITLLPLLFFSCNPKNSADENRIVIGISSDVQTFNTLFAFSYEESMITDILFPGLFDFRWNYEKGELEPSPMIAKSWEWSDDSSNISLLSGMIFTGLTEQSLQVMMWFFHTTCFLIQ